MKDLQDKVGDILYERLSSPFAHSFIIAWIFFNRNLMLYLFTSSGINFDERTTKIDTLLNYYNGLLWPLLGAFASIIVYVLASWGAHFIWEIFILAKKKSRDKLHKKVLLTEDDADMLRKMNADLRENLSSMQKGREVDISNIKSEMEFLIDSHKEEINRLSKKFQREFELAKQNKAKVEKDSKLPHEIIFKEANFTKERAKG